MPPCESCRRPSSVNTVSMTRDLLSSNPDISYDLLLTSKRRGWVCSTGTCTLFGNSSCHVALRHQPWGFLSPTQEVAAQTSRSWRNVKRQRSEEMPCWYVSVRGSLK